MTIGRPKRVRPITAGVAATAALALVLAGCSSGSDDETDEEATEESSESAEGSYTTEEVTDGTTSFTIVTNPGDGAQLSYGSESGIELIEEADGDMTYAFKDINGNGELDTFEDWRVDASERASDLAGQLSREQIAGLMLFSPSERSPQDGLTDVQRAYLGEDNLRLILNAGSNDVEDNVTWVNEIQAYVETQATAETPYIPVTFSTDPRSDSTGGYSGSATAEVSLWPGNLGLAATFDPAIAEQFGQMASSEYRSLGLTNVLSPQLDVASDPRWMRLNGTFGESPELSGEMTAAFVRGFQEAYEENGELVGGISTVIKHFAGDAAGEGGRASYYESGMYAVFPGDNFDQHVEPFLEGLDAAGAMTTYSILLDGEGEPLLGDRVAGAFNKDLVDILRVDNNYNGVIMTDWGVTAGGPADPDASWYTNWGVENLTVEERHFLVLQTGIDMFGGNTEVAPVLAAYDMWDEAYQNGETDIDAQSRFVQSAERILAMVFDTGVFDAPFVDLENSLEVVGSSDKVEAGFDAQTKSVVVLKNVDGAVTCSAPEGENPYADATVYIPRTYDVGLTSMYAEGTYTEGLTVPQEVAEQYFGEVVTDEAELGDNGEVISYTAPDLSDVDVVLVALDSPNNGYGFSPNAGQDPDTGEYRPISLQYRPYTADGPNVRQVSLSGDILEDGTQENRSYFGATGVISNEASLDSFERAVQAVADSGRDIPVLTMLRAKNPIIPAEFEAGADAIAVGFDISDEAILEVLLGLRESSGRLPIAFPADMDTVEANEEDVPFDLDPYVDASGNAYEFGFGLNCSAEPIE